MSRLGFSPWFTFPRFNQVSPGEIRYATYINTFNEATVNKGFRKNFVTQPLMGVGQITMDSSEESLRFKAVFFILSKAEIGIIEVLIKFPANLISHD